MKVIKIYSAIYYGTHTFIIYDSKIENNILKRNISNNMMTEFNT